jgi:hypothetical protein
MRHVPNGSVAQTFQKTAKNLWSPTKSGGFSVRESTRPESRVLGSLEDAQPIANHESARTTKLYDCTSDQISFDEIERIPYL